MRHAPPFFALEHPHAPPPPPRPDTPVTPRVLASPPKHFERPTPANPKQPCVFVFPAGTVGSPPASLARRTKTTTFKYA